MIKVYVAGAYSANNVIDVLQNIGRGEEYAARLFAIGFAPFCPWHDKSYAMILHGFKFTVKDFQDFSIAWLKVSDCVFLVPGWEESEGTTKEIELAEQLNIPVFKSTKKLLHFKRQREA